MKILAYLRSCLTATAEVFKVLSSICLTFVEFMNIGKRLATTWEAGRERLLHCRHVFVYLALLRGGLWLGPRWYQNTSVSLNRYTR